MEGPIAYGSRTLTKAERKYYITRKELLAVVHFRKYFKHYLFGKHWRPWVFSTWRNEDALSRIPCKHWRFTIDWESQTLKQVVAHVKKDEIKTEYLRSIQDNDAQITQVKGWVLANKPP